jgi:hypothetical protein
MGIARSPFTFRARLGPERDGLFDRSRRTRNVNGVYSLSLTLCQTARAPSLKPAMKSALKRHSISS